MTTNLTPPGLLPSGLSQPSTFTPTSFTTAPIGATMPAPPGALGVSPVKPVSPVLPLSPGTSGLINPVLPLKSGSPGMIDPPSPASLQLTPGLAHPVSPLTGLGNQLNPVYGQGPMGGFQRSPYAPPPPPPPPPPLHFSPHRPIHGFHPPMQPVMVQQAMPVQYAQQPTVVHMAAAPPQQVPVLTAQPIHHQAQVVQSVPVVQAQLMPQTQYVMAVPPPPPPPPIIHMQPPMGAMSYPLFR